MPSALVALAEDFWSWRADTQPSAGDDIPRIERPSKWIPDWSPDAVARRRERLGAFQDALAGAG